VIFIHSSFRVASTWLWSRFRAVEGGHAYYEVFNEQLATISRSRARSVAPDSWHSRHPPTEPYFLEYLPLIRLLRGVRGFDRAMGFGRFIPRGGPGGDIGTDERAYLARLIDHAEALDRYPVLTSTRSLGRVAGLKRAFPGLHIVLYRNLFDQWCSYVEQHAHGNSHFLSTVKWTIERNRHDPFLRALAEQYPLDDPDPTDIVLFTACAALHAYAYAHAVNEADLVIDVHLLADDAGHRMRAERFIRTASGLAVNLCGARNSPPSRQPVPAGAEERIADLRVMLAHALEGIAGTAGHDFAMSALDRLSADLVHARTKLLVTAANARVRQDVAGCETVAS
jgi:hypothetical protein